MLFNSYIFILFFLPIAVLGYFLLQKTHVHILPVFYLLVLSLFFYGFADRHFLRVLFVMVCMNYVIWCMFRLHSRFVPRQKWLRMLLLWGGIGANALILSYYKYYNFIVDNVNHILHQDFSYRDMVLPLGISFIFFQQIAFLVDAYGQEVPECNPIEYALYISFFPKVSSGPIISRGEFFPILKDTIKQKVNWDNIAIGIYFFVIGLAKKILIADMFAKAVNWGYDNIASLNSASALLISLAYSIQIYFDFSGYSDMAIGISKMLNFDFPVNFNSPYKAVTILDFWKRWHITLTRFLTKYLYIPLGGSHHGKPRTYLNIVIVFLCSGLWHGADWTFVLWGLSHGILMVLTRALQKYIEKIPKVITGIFTFLFVDFTWILFRSGSFTVFIQMISRIFSNTWGAINSEIINAISIPALSQIPWMPGWLVTLLIILLVIFMMFFCKNTQEKTVTLNYKIVPGLWLVFLAVLCVLSLSQKSTYVYSLF